jgi:putative ABC transport system permease protein
MLMNLWFDLKYAWRLALKTPGHAMLCIVVIALSVGLTLFCYVIDYNIALKPLPFPGSERWLSVQIAPKSTDLASPRIDAYTYQELLKGTRTVKHLGAFSSSNAVLSEGEASNSLRAAAISPSLFSALQTPPQVGRLFDPNDSQNGATPVVILSFDTWQNYFAGDPRILGKQARIDGRPVQIIGVMPEGFLAFRDFEMWTPLQLEVLGRAGESETTLTPLVVLEPGQDAAAVLREMQPVVAAINQANPQLFDAGRQVELFSAHQMWSHGDVQVLAMASFIAVAVLLLGCVNVSMIFFARLLERSRELALRRALGSSRWRLLRECLLETMFFVLPGLVLGVVLAVLAVDWAAGIREFSSQVRALGRAPSDLVMQPADLLAAVVAAALIWLLSTLIPAWRLARQDPSVVLGGSGKGSATTPGRSIISNVLVGVQVIISCLLLVICSNMVSAVNEELSKPLGLNSTGIIASTYPTVFSERYADGAERLRYWDELEAGIKGRIPGAEVAFTTAVPTDASSVTVTVEDQQRSADQPALTVPLASVSDAYFELLGLTLRAGRWFDRTDNDASLPVALIDEDMARRYWPGEEALGKRIKLNADQDAPWLSVVGVVSAVNGPYSGLPGMIYRPLRQALPADFELLVKVPPAAAGSAAALRGAAFAVDRDLPLHNLQALEDVLNALNGYRSMVPGFSGIATVILILAATGLFGLISRSVARRTQEVGVRRALGATQWRVSTVFLRQGLLYLGIGLVGGCFGIVITNLMTASIPNVLTRAIPVTIGVFVLMALVIFIASYLPTRRAVSLEPGDALRYE